MKKTVDLLKISNGKKHINNGDSFEICIREDVENAKGYDGENMFLLCFFNENVKENYLLTAHDGKPFKNSRDIKMSLHSNISGGHGFQGLGAKVATYGLNIDPMKAKTIFMSNTVDEGYKAFKVQHVTENQTEIVDVTKSTYNIVLKILGKETFKKYNVFYLRTYNPNAVKSSLGKGNKNTSLITSSLNMLSLSKIANINDINVEFLDYYLDSIKQFDSRQKTSLSKINFNDFVSKEFKISTKNVIFKENIYGSEKKYTFDADVHIYVLPNIRDNNTTHNEIYHKNYGKYSSPRVTHKSFNKFTTFLFQDRELGDDSTNRLTTQPIMVSKHYTNKLIEILGIEPIDGHLFSGDDIDSDERLKNALNGYFVRNHNLNYKDNIIANPSILLEIKLKNVKDFYGLIGGIDSTFYTTEPKKLYRIMKSVMEKIYSDGSIDLKNTRDYLNIFKPKVNSNDYLPCYRGSGVSTNIEVELIMTDSGYDLAKYQGWGFLPISGKKINKLPLGNTMPLTVKIKDVNTDKFIVSDNVYPSDDGIIYNHIGNGNYHVTVDKPFHIENGVKIYHDIKDHIRSVNYYPKKEKNDLLIDGKYYKANIKVDLNIPNSIRTPKTITTKLTNDGYKEKHDIYRAYDNYDIIVKYNKNRGLLLNTNNIWVKKLTYNKPKSMMKLWSDIYKKFNDIAVKELYYNNDNIVDKYKMSGNDNLFNGYSDEKEIVLNSMIKLLIQVDPDCLKLISTNPLENKEDDGLDNAKEEVVENENNLLLEMV